MKTRSAEELNRISEAAIGAAIEVHMALGPGLLESAYEGCLEHELTSRGHTVARQILLPVIYKGTKVDCGFRLDLVIDDSVILEIKSVDRLEAIHTAQLLTYLKLTELHLGLLMNFNVTRLVDGVKRIVHQFPLS